MRKALDLPGINDHKEVGPKRFPVDAPLACDSHRQAFAADRVSQLIADREAEEIDILRRFLPPQLDDETRELAVDQVIAELGASKLKDIGRVMNELKRRYPGQMNFSAVRRRLCDQLS